MQILKENIKQKIIEVSKKRFHKHGFEHTSMNDIASEVGISTGNIYRYFKTKNQILNDILKIIEDRTENLLTMISEASTKENYEEIFETLSDEIVKLASEESDSLQVLFHCEDMKQFKDFKERTINVTKDALKNTFKDKPISDTVYEAIAICLFDGLAHIVKETNSNIDELKENLKIYSDIVIKNLEIE